jgi:hypothetical protein
MKQLQNLEEKKLQNIEGRKAFMVCKKLCLETAR